MKDTDDYYLPWEFLHPEDDAYCYVFDGKNEQVIRLPSRNSSIARHIVACVNACQGLRTDFLEELTSNGSTINLEVMRRILQKDELRMTNITESEGGEP